MEVTSDHRRTEPHQQSLHSGTSQFSQKTIHLPPNSVSADSNRRVVPLDVPQPVKSAPQTTPVKPGSQPIFFPGLPAGAVQVSGSPLPPPKQHIDPVPTPDTFTRPTPPPVVTAGTTPAPHIVPPSLHPSLMILEKIKIPEGADLSNFDYDSLGNKIFLDNSGQPLDGNSFLGEDTDHTLVSQSQDHSLGSQRNSFSDVDSAHTLGLQRHREQLERHRQDIILRGLNFAQPLPPTGHHFTPPGLEAHRRHTAKLLLEEERVKSLG